MISKLVSVVILLGLISSGCVHRAPVVANGVQGLSEDEYAPLVTKHTVKANEYHGFFQLFQADLTSLDSEFLAASLRQRAGYLQWEQSRFNLEVEKGLQENAASARYFVRFYCPENENDDLHLPRTIWKFFLDVNGQRFEGKVKKINDKYIELKTLYPHFDRFSTPYELTFNVPMATLEKQAYVITLTSTLGAAEFRFPKMK